MRYTLINGTNRPDNKTAHVRLACASVLEDGGHEVRHVTLEHFTQTFTQYTNLSNATTEQRADIEHMAWAERIVFFVPTYHHGMPGSLKNFLDIVAEKSAYDHKILSLISVNRSGNLWAYQCMQSLQGILAFHKVHSCILPTIPVIDPGNIDTDRLARYIDTTSTFSL